MLVALLAKQNCNAAFEIFEMDRRSFRSPQFNRGRRPYSSTYHTRYKPTYNTMYNATSNISSNSTSEFTRTPTPIPTADSTPKSESNVSYNKSTLNSTIKSNSSISTPNSTTSAPTFTNTTDSSVASSSTSNKTSTSTSNNLHHNSNDNKDDEIHNLERFRVPQGKQHLIRYILPHIYPPDSISPSPTNSDKIIIKQIVSTVLDGAYPKSWKSSNKNNDSNTSKVFHNIFYDQDDY